MRNASDKVVEKIKKKHVLCSVTLFRKSHHVWDNAEKYNGDRGTTNDATTWRIGVACWISKSICMYAHAYARAPWYPTRTHTQACTHRHICNTYCFSIASMVSWTRLSVTLYVHCLSCFELWDTSGSHSGIADDSRLLGGYNLCGPPPRSVETWRLAHRHDVMSQKTQLKFPDERE